MKMVFALLRELSLYWHGVAFFFVVLHLWFYPYLALVAHISNEISRCSNYLSNDSFVSLLKVAGQALVIFELVAQAEMGLLKSGWGIRGGCPD